MKKLLLVFCLLAVFGIVQGANAATQRLVLNPGWNWVSFNVLPTSGKVADVLGKAGFTANDIIVTSNAMSRFTGASWLPGSFTIEYGKMYQLYVSKVTTIDITGEACKLWYVPLSAGWNWIANMTMQKYFPPTDLAHNGNWMAGDRIQSMNGFATYTGSKWIPATGFSMNPGVGYQIYAGNDGILTFPEEEDDDELYVVVDLSDGPNALTYPVRYTNAAPNLNDDTCRTTELWLRKIPAGTFIMGSPDDEVGRLTTETQHKVTLTQDYYIGVFECTQKQWELVMGSNPSDYKGDCRPVEKVTYDMIRGTGAQTGAGWPIYSHEVDIESFMGKLQAKTGLVFDLPTEAQWEYACRAGTTTALNSGKNPTSISSDSAMDEVGRYYYNQSDGMGGYSQHTKVGSYLRNAWGLYDMHGNVYEWCLDWYLNYGITAVWDPVGAPRGTYRVLRGGGWHDHGMGNCRSAYLLVHQPLDNDNSIGFRVALHPSKNQGNDDYKYIVVDLSEGASASIYPVRYSANGPDLSDDTCRTTELWLRKIPAGTFIMGSPSDELGRNSNEIQHEVTLTNDFYIGVFECTQKQWELVMGSKPSSFKNETYYATRPVETVSYNMIRGSTSTTGVGWPAYGHNVDALSFMGRLKSKTGLVFDLPTEAEWEYACRAGTTTALNSGKNLSSTGEDVNMTELGRYLYNGGQGNVNYNCTTEHGTAKVGSYLPNIWGLYDMHGNVWEWCLDWFGNYGTEAVSNPTGPKTGSHRVARGACWGYGANTCRSALRKYYNDPWNSSDGSGFRIAMFPIVWQVISDPVPGISLPVITYPDVIVLPQ